jgi:hypothetical protein
MHVNNECETDHTHQSVDSKMKFVICILHEDVISYSIKNQILKITSWKTIIEKTMTT